MMQNFKNQDYESLFNQMPKAAWVIDGSTTMFLDCNLASERQYG